MEVFAAIIVIGVAILIGILLQTLFLNWGAAIAKIDSRTFGKSFITVILGGIASFVFGLVLSVLPGLGTAVGFIAGFLITALIMMPIFQTTFGKALAATVIAWALGILVIGGGIAIFVFVFGGMAIFAA